MFKCKTDYKRKNLAELNEDFDSDEWTWHADEYLSYKADILSVMIDGHECHIGTFYTNAWSGVVVIDEDRHESISFKDMQVIEEMIQSEIAQSVEAFL